MTSTETRQWFLLIFLIKFNLRSIDPRLLLMTGPTEGSTNITEKIETIRRDLEDRFKDSDHEVFPF